MTNIAYIKENTPMPAIYENLAKECIELAHAALKKARIIRDENPTTADPDEVDERLTEEFTDIMVCIAALDISIDFKIYEEKLGRWHNRITEHQA